MRTAQVRSITWLRRCINWLGFASIVSSLSANSTGWFLIAGVLWWCAAILVDRSWVYVEKGVVILDDGVAIRRINDTYYISRAELPKGFSLWMIKDASGAAKISLHALSTRDGGVIVPIDLTIRATVGNTLREITLYCQFFNKQNKEGSQCIHELFERFLRDQLRPKGVFGHVHSQYIGTPEWVELTLTKALWDFLANELSAVGLQIRSIEVICGKTDKCIVLEGGS